VVVGPDTASLHDRSLGLGGVLPFDAFEPAAVAHLVNLLAYRFAAFINAEPYSEDFICRSLVGFAVIAINVELGIEPAGHVDAPACGKFGDFHLSGDGLQTRTLRPAHRHPRVGVVPDIDKVIDVDLVVNLDRVGSGDVAVRAPIRRDPFLDELPIV
jgi:hypothetical protein